MRSAESARSWPGAAWNTIGPRRAYAWSAQAPWRIRPRALDAVCRHQDRVAKSSWRNLPLRNSLSSAWGRIFFQFGPYEHPDRLVPSVIRHLLLNQEALCTHGRQIRSFLHVADVGAAFAHLLDSEVQGPVNIGSDERIAAGGLDRSHRAEDRAARSRAAWRPQRARRRAAAVGAGCASPARRGAMAAAALVGRGHQRHHRVVARAAGVCEAAMSPLPSWHPLVVHFPIALVLVGDGVAARGAIAAQRISGGDRGDRGNLESVLGRRGRRVCARHGTWRGARSGRERSRAPSHLAAHEVGDVYDAAAGAAGRLARRGHRIAVAALVDLPRRARWLRAPRWSSPVIAAARTCTNMGWALEKSPRGPVEAPRGDRIDHQSAYCAGMAPVKYAIT